MGLLRLPCFFNCVQRIERYSALTYKEMELVVKPWNQAPDLPTDRP